MDANALFSPAAGIPFVAFDPPQPQRLRDSDAFTHLFALLQREIHSTFAELLLRRLRQVPCLGAALQILESWVRANAIKQGVLKRFRQDGKAFRVRLS